MANPNAPFGFRPFKHGVGVGGRLNEYQLSSAYGTALYQGDVVKSDGSGYLAKAAATDAILGVFWGVRYTATDGSVVFKRNWVASTATQSGSLIFALVYDDPLQEYLVQSVGTTALTDQADFTNLNTGTAGNATTGISAMMAAATTGSLVQWRISKVITANDKMPCRNAAGNPDFYDVGANGLLVVRAVKHEALGSAAGVLV